jgi:hypothetical protein
MLVASCDAPSAPSITRADTTHASDIGSFHVRDSTSTTAYHGEPGATMARSPTLAANNATRVRRRPMNNWD